jgi:hypothetical protein
MTNSGCVDMLIKMSINHNNGGEDKLGGTDYALIDSVIVFTLNDIERSKA